MSISGQQNINIGLPNESIGSDSLYTAFTKTQQNFSNLFNSASPYNTFVAGNGIGVTANANTGTVTITNQGVTNIIAGTNIVVSNSNGNVTISSTGGNGGTGTVTRVGMFPVSTTRLTVNDGAGGNIVSDGNFTIDLASSGVTAGTYNNPNVTIDTYGRIISAANGSIAGTVTSVGLTPGAGIQVAGGPVTSNGNITVTNTGVLRLNAGSGISLSGANGNVTVSATMLSGTVTLVNVTSSSLTVTGGPVVTAGTINIELPNSPSFSGTVTAGNVSVSGKAIFSGSEDLAPSGAANLNLTASYFTTSSAETATLAAGTEGQVKTFMMKGDGGDMVITVTNAGWKTSGTGTMTFDTIGDSCILQYISGKWFCVGNNGVVFA